MRVLKTKRKRKRGFLSLLFFIGFFVGSFYLVFSYLYQTFILDYNNEKLMKDLVNNTVPVFRNSYTSYNLTDYFLFTSLGLEKEVSLPVSKEDDPPEIMEPYVEDPFSNTLENPILYIYNTHQTEGFIKNNDASYNVTPSVLMASYILREKLKSENVSALVETNNITEILRANNWKYSSSYKASRLLIQDALEKNQSILYTIDLHRDSVARENTTATIDGKNYAKILLVVGKDYEGYQKNQALAEKLKMEIEKIEPSLMRGISLKGGSGVNGIYNQDLGVKSLLIELGGQYNTIEEVNNTLDVLASALASLIKEEGI